jgi:pimeloyl-ACP methyl ester carboxylesterase
MNFRLHIHRHLIVLLLSSVLWAQPKGRQSDDSRGSAKSGLPIPSGSYAVGRRAFDLTGDPPSDSSSSLVAEHRELMIYIWYPTTRSSSKSSSEYFPFAADIDKDPKYKESAHEIFGASWPMIVDGSVHAHAITDAPPVVDEQFPVVLFFPGYSSTTFSYTAQIEHLVSHGYVVVAVEDTNGSGLVRFSDGRIGLLQSPPPSPSRTTDPFQSMIASAQLGTQRGAEQVRRVRGALKKITPLSKVMDLSKVAVVGHSAGGTLAARACQIDPQIKVCISEEGEVNPVGAFFDYSERNSMQQPFLLIEVEHNPTDEELARMHESRTQWNEFLAHEQWQLRQCGQGSYLIQLSQTGMGHSSFSDGPILNARDDEQAALALENLRVTEELEKAFLDKYLKGVSTSIFDRHHTPGHGMVIKSVGQ